MCRCISGEDTDPGQEVLEAGWGRRGRERSWVAIADAGMQGQEAGVSI